MTGGKSTNHEETSTNTGIATSEAQLFGDLDQSAGGALTRKTLGLVDLGEHSVGGLRHKSRGETSNQTRAQVDHSLGSIRSGVLVNSAVDSFGNLLVDDELGHGVWNLLEQNRTEPAVEGTDTFVGEDLAEAGDEAVGKGWLGDETDTGGLERAEGDVSEELGKGGGDEVDGRSVVGRGFISEVVDGLLLEEFVSAKLEGALEEVAGEGWANTGQQSAGTFIGDDLSEAADETSVVCDGIQLYSCLHAIHLVSSHPSPWGKYLHIHWSESTVSDGAADCTSEGESAVQTETGELLWLIGSDRLNGSVELDEVSD